MLSEMVSRMADAHTLVFTLPLFSIIATFSILIFGFIVKYTITKYLLDTLNFPGLLSQRKSLPGPSFHFPNGQGTEKFFSGRDVAQQWRTRYGSIYSIWSGFKREIVITKPDHVQAFYKDSHTHIKASDNNSGWLFRELLGSCVGVVSQKRWLRVRAPFEHHFTRPASSLKTRLFINEARSFLQLMSKGNEELIINVTNDVKYCPFFMVASIFFGPLATHQREAMYMIGPLRETLFRDAFSGGINRYGFAKYLPGSAMPKLREFHRLWENFVRQAYDEAVIGNGGAIVSLWEAMERAEISKEELLQTLDESLFANLDVTAHALSWNVLRIAQHGDIQKGVRQEIWTNSHSGEAYEEYLRRENTLLAACILETSRLHPILPFSNPEAAPTDKTVGGYRILRNTDVIVDTYAINVDNPYWENSTEFNPHRHLGLKDQSRRYNMWRFGFGPRQCLGKNIADIILRVIIAEMLRGYQLDILDERKHDEIELQADSWIGLPDGIVRLTLLPAEV